MARTSVQVDAGATVAGSTFSGVDATMARGGMVMDPKGLTYLSFLAAGASVMGKAFGRWRKSPTDAFVGPEGYSGQPLGSGLRGQVLIVVFNAMDDRLIGTLIVDPLDGFEVTNI